MGRVRGGHEWRSVQVFSYLSQGARRGDDSGDDDDGQIEPGSLKVDRQHHILYRLKLCKYCVSLTISFSCRKVSSLGY